MLSQLEICGFDVQEFAKVFILTRRRHRSSVLASVAMLYCGFGSLFETDPPPVPDFLGKLNEPFRGVSCEVTSPRLLVLPWRVRWY